MGPSILTPTWWATICEWWYVQSKGKFLYAHHFAQYHSPLEK